MDTPRLTGTLIAIRLAARENQMPVDTRINAHTVRRQIELVPAWNDAWNAMKANIARTAITAATTTYLFIWLLNISPVQFVTNLPKT